MDPADATLFGAPVRTIVVPPDIVAVKRTSPVKVKRHSPWRDRPAGHVIERAGGREWLSDHGSVEPRAPLRAAYGTSMTAHLSGVLVLVGGLVATPDHLPAVRLTPALVMPVMLSMLPATSQASPGPPPSDRRLPRESRGGAAPRQAEPASEIASLRHSRHRRRSRPKPAPKGITISPAMAMLARKTATAMVPAIAVTATERPATPGTAVAGRATASRARFALARESNRPGRSRT